MALFAAGSLYLRSERPTARAHLARGARLVQLMQLVLIVGVPWVIIFLFFERGVSMLIYQRPKAFLDRCVKP